MRMFLIVVAIIALLGVSFGASASAWSSSLNGLFTARQGLIVGPVQADATIARTLSTYSSTMESDLAGATTGTGVTSAASSVATCAGLPCVSVTLGSQNATGILQVKDAQDVTSSMFQGQ